MPSLKNVKTKIAGVKKTKQITKAMNMVASAKLRGAQQRIEHFRPYAEKFYEMLQQLVGKEGMGDANPLLADRATRKRCGIVLATSDRGLCGSFNVNIISAALRLAAEKTNLGREVVFYCVGKKGRDAVAKSDYALAEGYNALLGKLDFNLAHSLGTTLINKFLSEDLDEIVVVYSEFVSLARQVPKTLQVLPMAPASGEGAKASGDEPDEYIFEPDAVSILAEVLPRFINAQVYRALLDTSASEHAARMTAMDNATRNCDDMAASLTLLFNKTRQAAITRDLMDIVGGAEALKG